MPLAAAITARTEVHCPRDFRRVLTAVCSAAAPCEAVALLGGHRIGTKVHLAAGVALTNVRAAADRFVIDAVEFARREADLRAAGLEFVGFLHSHPGGPPIPSPIDRTELWRDCVHVIAGGGPRHWRLRVFVATGNGLHPAHWRY